MARGRIPQAGQQHHQGGFPGSSCPDDRQGGAGLRLDLDVLQYRNVTAV
jgi:hypothetical protein